MGLEKWATPRVKERPITKMSTILTVCDTCKREGWDPEINGKTDGEALAELVTAAARGQKTLTVRTRSCLMGCDFACNVTIQDPEKISYAVGMFEPTQDAAEAIVDYALKHAQSNTGQVPYRTWPDGIKGHFRARTYPPDTSDT